MRVETLIFTLWNTPEKWKWSIIVVSFSRGDIVFQLCCAAARQQEL
jgi:hypothetical protein